MPFPFLRLPGELRDQIYRDCLLESKLLHLVLDKGDPRKNILRAQWRISLRRYKLNHEGALLDDGRNMLSSLLSILRVCRKTYTEAMPIFFHAIRWGFTSPRVLLLFLHQIGPRCRQHLSHIAIWYQDSNPDSGLNDPFSGSGYKDYSAILASCGALSHFNITFGTVTPKLLLERFGRNPVTLDCLETLRYSIRGVPNVSILLQNPEYLPKYTGYHPPLMDVLFWFRAYRAGLQNDLMRPKVQDSDRWHSSGTTSEPTLQTPDGRWLLLNGPTFHTDVLPALWPH